MILKIVFGIVIPLVIIISLAIIANIDSDFSVSFNYSKSLNLNEISHEGKIRSYVKIGEVNLENNYFLPKRFTLEPLYACLVDEEKISRPITAGNIEFSEGDYNYEGNFDYYSQSKDRSVEINSNEKKIVNIYLMPIYSFSYMNLSMLIEEYGEYDKIIIIQNTQNKNYYSVCESATPGEIESAVTIPLIIKDTQIIVLN